MKSFRKVQEMLLFYLEGEMIDEEGFAMLYEAYNP